MYNNNNNNNNDIGERVPPSIKLERKQIRAKTIREKNEELKKKNELPQCAKKLFNN